MLKEKLFYAVEFVFCALLLILTLLLSVRLTAESDALDDLEKRRSQLETENAVLQAKCESRLPLEYIEQYATEVLGMRRCSPEQIIYISGQLP